MKHANISVFVPHNGCPHKCSFCNQVTITGKAFQPKAGDVDSAVRTAIMSSSEKNYETEIAFFGGSFTAIDRGYMQSLLEAAYKYVEKGQVKGIRISTRPDYIDGEILSVLKKYGVTSIELGAQSMDDEVLLANERGHSAGDVIKASELIKENGFSLGLQMMTGLYLDTDEKAVKTAQSIIALNPETVRIYPTLLMPDTALEKLYEKGIYSPQTLSGAVDLCAVLLQMFWDSHINVIRVGLHDTQELHEKMIAGPYHPAFRELCEARIMRNKIENFLSGKAAGEYCIEVNPKDISKFIGQKKENIVYFGDKGYSLKFIPNSDINQREFKLL